MPLVTNDVIDKFGTQAVVSGASPTAIVNGAMTVQSDVVAWVNSDDVELANFLLTFQIAVGPIVATGIHLFARLMDVKVGINEPIPSLTWEEHHLGSFIADTSLANATDTTLSLGYDAELLNSKVAQGYEFYLKNDVGVTISAGWELIIVPKAKGGKV